MGDIKGPAPEVGDPDRWAHGVSIRIPSDWGTCNASPISPELVAAAGPDVAQALAMQDIGSPINPSPQLGQIVVEVDLGPDDVLVLTTDRALCENERMMLEKQADTVLASGVRRTLVLDKGTAVMVLHRTAPADGSKPRKDRPYLEDMARAGAGEVPCGTSDSEPA